MTTIAYKDGIIAYDSRTTANDIITNDNHDKKSVVDGVVFIMSGATSDRQRFIDIYFDKRNDFKNCDASALVVNDGKLYLVSIDDNDGMWKQPMELDNPCALGSGSRFALTAMDCGLGAEKAVEMAMKRDIRTGGKVNIHVI